MGNLRIEIRSPDGRWHPFIRNMASEESAPCVLECETEAGIPEPILMTYRHGAWVIDRDTVAASIVIWAGTTYEMKICLPITGGTPISTRWIHELSTY